jgi:hypothetical protein
VTLDPQQRRLDLRRAGTAQQHHQQLGVGTVDLRRVLHGEHPDPGRDRRDDPLLSEPLPACPRARGQRLGCEHAKRREQTRSFDVATPLDRVKDRGRHLLGHLELL